MRGVKLVVNNGLISIRRFSSVADAIAELRDGGFYVTGRAVDGEIAWDDAAKRPYSTQFSRDATDTSVYETATIRPEGF